MARKKRTDLTLRQKLDILDMIGSPRQCSFTTIARQYNLDCSTVSKIYKKREQIRAVASTAASSEGGNEVGEQEGEFAAAGLDGRKRSRGRLAEDIEEPLHNWYQFQVECGELSSDQIIKIKAQELATQFQIANFKPTNGWLDRWKKRYCLKRERYQFLASPSALQIDLTGELLSLVLNASVD